MFKHACICLPASCAWSFFTNLYHCTVVLDALIVILCNGLMVISCQSLVPGLQAQSVLCTLRKARGVALSQRPVCMHKRLQSQPILENHERLKKRVRYACMERSTYPCPSLARSARCRRYGQKIDSVEILEFSVVIFFFLFYPATCTSSRKG